MKRKLKDTISEIFHKTFENPLIWRLYQPLAELNAELYYSKKEVGRKFRNEAFLERYKYLLIEGVRRGPFKGLKYPFYSSIHSTFFPKLLGYYEFELQEDLVKMSKNNYSKILDVGCAEGYYAVGFAKLFPQSQILAYDIDSQAREKTLILANANGIEASEKFMIKEACSPEELVTLNPSSKHLIFSDCEGYEKDLFSTEVINHLKNSDFIIEVHDFIFPGTSDILISRFSQTHEVKVVQSVGDIQRYRLINDLDLLGLPLEDQIRLLAEKRPGQMEWLICTSLTLDAQ